MSKEGGVDIGYWNMKKYPYWKNNIRDIADMYEVNKNSLEENTKARQEKVREDKKVFDVGDVVALKSDSSKVMTISNIAANPSPMINVVFWNTAGSLETAELSYKVLRIMKKNKIES